MRGKLYLQTAYSSKVRASQSILLRALYWEKHLHSVRVTTWGRTGSWYKQQQVQELTVWALQTQAHKSEPSFVYWQDTNYALHYTHPKLGVLVFSTWLLYFLICIILTFSCSNDHRTIYFDKFASWRPATRHLLCWYLVFFAVGTAPCCIGGFLQQQSWWP